jgi:hypothetical protein
MADGMNAKNSETVVIRPPSIAQASFILTGTSPLMTARFSKKMEILAKHQDVTTKSKRSDRKAKSVEQDLEDATYISPDGWYGLHAAALRNAMISACRLVAFKMTLAKMSIFVEADGYDKIDYLPLLKIDGERKQSVMHTRNATGVVDVRVRPMWSPGWVIRPTLRWDTDQFSASDVTNLLMRVGMQVGLGEGRPDSKSSAGLGYGLFSVST